MIDRILDKLALQPSRGALDVGELQRFWLPFGADRVEIFLRTVPAAGAAAEVGEPAWDLIKFVGAGGRAENVSCHPFDILSDHPGRIWVANPPGFGGSTGRARLSALLPVALATCDFVQSHRGGGPLLLMGGSLGAAVALRAATEVSCDGLILRDVPSMRCVILQRFGRWGPPAHWVARRVPTELNTIRAAGRCSFPAVFVVSQHDTIVPVSCQQRVLRAYRGPKQTVEVPAPHMGPFPLEEVRSYLRSLRWLEEQIALRSSPNVKVAWPENDPAVPPASERHH